MEKTEKGNTDVINKEMEEMCRAGVHFGYSRSRRHPKMSPFIFGIRNNVEIFDVEILKEKLGQARDFLKKMGSEKKTILFVGTKSPVKQLVKKSADSLQMPYVIERWLGGTLTNFRVLKKRVDYFLSLEDRKKSEEFEKCSKRERFQINKELVKLEKGFKGLENLKDLPDAMVVVDAKEESSAVREANKKSIPVVAILNSDSDLTGITYPIPANDSSVSSVDYLLTKLVEAYQS